MEMYFVGNYEIDPISKIYSQSWQLKSGANKAIKQIQTTKSDQWNNSIG